MEEILIRLDTYSCSRTMVRKLPQRVEHKDSDLFLMLQTGDQQKECIITAS